MLVTNFTKFIRTFTIYSLNLIRLLSARFWASCWGRGSGRSKVKDFWAGTAEEQTLN